ncbi:MAG: twitching motility protein PilT [Bacteroidetes bacterium CG02_land_8_20_14_3_00_31_25]|nr:type II toxin-antitoxin system VapC family toxin [Bacteroidota bacterium]PIV63071.1 MAG: twitching motility protein PilT [Bacteroidetes bacterium CG02_land_8_20_14_3_00_31_25]PIX32655.1 MAG: twitching motility protein PilT [Bacteroidetes bacterium CG_4_8_14_3_um_filter_31_14]
MANRKMVVDTSIFIEHLRAKDKTKTTLFSIPENQKILISAITLFELFIGATTAEKWNDIQKLTNGIEIIPLSPEIAEESAKIFQELKIKNQVIEFRDIFIAATAIICKLPIKTLNTKHFIRIPDL